MVWLRPGAGVSSITFWLRRWTEQCPAVRLQEEDVDYIVENTAISRQQIEQQFEVFIANHPDGRISKKSFRC